MKKIVKKWEGGAKKHGGIGKAMGVQIDKWVQSAEEQAQDGREAEELRRQLEHERLAKEAEELRQRLEHERLAKEAEELRRQLEHERLTREAEERERLEQEQVRKTLELSKKRAEELEELRLAEKLSKESFEKSQRDKIIDFLRRSDDVSDDAAFPALDIVQRWESTNKELIEELHSFGDEALNKFLSSVEIIGDSSF